MAKKRRINIPMVLACILFYRTVITSHFTGGLMARYTTSATAGDSARVIKFGDFYVESDLSKGILIPGVDMTENAVVHFGGSESATYVFIVVETPGWTVSADKYSFTETSSGHIRWSIDTTNIATTDEEDGKTDGEIPWTYLVSNDYKHVYYTQVRPNARLNKKIIKTGDNNATILVDAELRRSQLESIATAIRERKTCIDITGFVVQSGGFENVKAAWDSIAQAAKKSSAKAPEIPQT